MQTQYHHIPVFSREIVDLLKPKQNDNFIDATVGGGSHAYLIAEQTGPQGRLIGLDVDPDAANAAAEKLRVFGDRVSVLRASYVELSAIVRQHSEIKPIRGILIDCGLSSNQLDDSNRGFSFNDTGTLDMRFNTEDPETASDLIQRSSEENLTLILKQYGEVPNARRIAKSILRKRDEYRRQGTADPLTVEKIVDAVLAEVPLTGRNRIHPATLIFQALRIAVNRELENITRFLPQAGECLARGGRLAVITYHSLEDRIVKEYFRQESRDCICPPSIPVCRCGHTARISVVTRKAVQPSEEEINRNPRSRSAHLRVAEKII